MDRKGRAVHFLGIAYELYGSFVGIAYELYGERWRGERVKGGEEGRGMGQGRRGRGKGEQ